MLYLVCILLSPSDFQCNFITSFQSSDLADFLTPYFKMDDLSSTTMTSTYLLFTGLWNAFLIVQLYLFSYLPTALLICIENTFWDINGDGNFVELFKKSFTLYVESGMREMTERDIEILINENDPTYGEFYKFIVNHYLGKFHCFYLYLSSNHCFFLLNTAQPGESQARAGGESASGESQGSEEPQGNGGRVFYPEQLEKDGKRFTWLQKLMLKFHRRQGHDGA